MHVISVSCALVKLVFNSIEKLPLGLVFSSSSSVTVVACYL